MLLIAWVHSKVKRNKTWVHSKRASSDGSLVRNGRERLGRVVLGGDGVCGGGEDGEALEVYALALCLCLGVEGDSHGDKVLRLCVQDIEELGVMQHIGGALVLQVFEVLWDRAR